ncbi:hypothetical protein [Hymenobacter psychrophilus]|uniref:Uncharacterized protein n=1 Tax=Hymenobacter psychrophilus TaxID=651662 RepID=A0A1H3P949_9BACT|nr:hypothetical protein [Hymenobacter psychrophilus]SDY97463.1 hypothetical protein SAMN04488069_1252 [Hymenobacter psychrophilus]
MMKSILLFAGLLLAGGAAFGQSAAVLPAEAPFRGANAILVQTPDSAGAALRTLAGLLVQQGYTIKRLDKEYHTLVTDPRPLEFGFHPVLIIKAVAVPGGLRMTGESEVDLATLGKSTSQAKFIGVEKSVYKGTFRVVEQMARLYPGGTLRYVLLP